MKSFSGNRKQLKKRKHGQQNYHYLPFPILIGDKIQKQ